MVSVGDSKLGSTEIHVIEPSVKVIGHTISSTFFSKKLLQDIYWISQGGFFVFQKDGASSTRHRRFPGAKGVRLAAKFSRLSVASVVKKFTDPELLPSMS